MPPRGGSTPFPRPPLLSENVPSFPDHALSQSSSQPNPPSPSFPIPLRLPPSLGPSVSPLFYPPPPSPPPLSHPHCPGHGHHHAPPHPLTSPRPGGRPPWLAPRSSGHPQLEQAAAAKNRRPADGQPTNAPRPGPAQAAQRPEQRGAGQAIRIHPSPWRWRRHRDRVATRRPPSPLRPTATIQLPPSCPRPSPPPLPPPTRAPARAGTCPRRRRWLAPAEEKRRRRTTLSNHAARPSLSPLTAVAPCWGLWKVRVGAGGG